MDKRSALISVYSVISIASAASNPLNGVNGFLGRCIGITQHGDLRRASLLMK